MGIGPSGLAVVAMRSRRWDELTDAEQAFAEQLVNDGCPAAEVARTVGAGAYAIGKRFRGRFSRADGRLYNRAVAELAEAGIHLYRGGA